MGLFQWLFRRKEHRPSTTWERRRPVPPDGPREYVDEDGRRHRADAPYLLPKDEKEIQRLDYQHFILRQILRGNCFAPVHRLLLKGGRVLDMGCGTGRWGYELAGTYSQAQVVGFDLEYISRTASTPLNYRFSRENLLHCNRASSCVHHAGVHDEGSTI